MLLVCAALENMFWKVDLAVCDEVEKSERV